MSFERKFLINSYEFIFCYSQQEGFSGVRIPPSTYYQGNGFQEAVMIAMEGYQEYVPVLECYDNLFEIAKAPDCYPDFVLDHIVDTAHEAMAQEFHPLTGQERAQFEIAIDRIADYKTNGLRRIVIEQRKSAKVEPGFIYLIRSSEGFYKIGKTKQPKKRLHRLGVTLPYPIEVKKLIETDSMSMAEIELHEQYATERERGEWFNLTDEQVQEICSIKDMMYGGAQ